MSSSGRLGILAAIGILGGGTIGFYFQHNMLEKYRQEMNERIEKRIVLQLEEDDKQLIQHNEFSQGNPIPIFPTSIKKI